jgi:hypothetical protein
VAFYNTPDRVTYSFPAVNFGSNTTRYIKGPAGKVGKIVEMLVCPTTSFTGTTAAGRLQLGDGVTATKYADLALGAAGAGPAAGAPVRATDVTKVGSGAALKGQDPNVLPFTFIPADQIITVTNLAPTGTPAGVADETITIEWFEA